MGQGVAWRRLATVRHLVAAGELDLSNEQSMHASSSFSLGSPSGADGRGAASLRVGVNFYPTTI